jgi:hypothetical protein
MKKSLTVMILVLAFATMVFAHGKAQKFMGTVKSVSATSLTITTKAGQEKTFTMDERTKFLHSGETAAVSDLKVGERVVVEADIHGEEAKAEVVKFGVPKKESSMQHQH